MPVHSNQRYLFLTLLFLPAANAAPANFSFDYIQATFTSSTIALSASPEEIEGNGIGFNLSLSFNPHYAITLDVLSSSFDTFQGNPVDSIKKTNLGLTAHTQITDSTEVFGNVSFLKTEFTKTDGISSTGDTDVAYELKIGLRHFLSKSFEAEVGASHFYAFDYPATSFNAEIRYYAYKQISIGFAYKTGDNQDSLSLNGRMSF